MQPLLMGWGRPRWWRGEGEVRAEARRRRMRLRGSGGPRRRLPLLCRRRACFGSPEEDGGSSGGRSPSRCSGGDRVDAGAGAGGPLRRPAAAVGRSGVAPAAVHVQVRQLQPLLPGARVRAAGGAGHHRVLPGGVAVQVPEPALHAVMSAARRHKARPVRCVSKQANPQERAQETRTTGTA
uniref:Uncharacterized protein n=2 Tax=Setaria italica TaxID=4555 RepID=K3ZA31_SETIT